MRQPDVLHFIWSSFKFERVLSPDVASQQIDSKLWHTLHNMYNKLVFFHMLLKTISPSITKFSMKQHKLHTLIVKHILGSTWTPMCLSCSFQIPFGPSRYWIKFSICDNLKHQKRCLEVLVFLECKRIWKGDCVYGNFLEFVAICQSWWMSQAVILCII